MPFLHRDWWPADLEERHKNILKTNSTIFLQLNEQNIRSAKNTLHFRKLPWMLGMWILRTSSNIVLGLSLITSKWEAKLPLNERFFCIICFNYVLQLGVRGRLKAICQNTHSLPAACIYHFFAKLPQNRRRDDICIGSERRQKRQLKSQIIFL